MAPPLIYNERNWMYKLGTGLLLLGTVLAIFSIISPGWYATEHAQSGASGYSHLWIVCTDGLYHCGVLGSSSFQAFEKATQAFVLIGLLVLLGACLLGVFLNFVTHSRAHNRWLEIATLTGGGFVFLGAIIFAGAGSGYVSEPNNTHLSPLIGYSLTLGYAMALTFVSAIVVLAGGAIIFIFNRPLELSNDVRSLSSLRNNDPVDRLHSDVEDDSEGGFRTAQLRVPSASRSPQGQTPDGSRPRSRAPPRFGFRSRAGDRAANGHARTRDDGDADVSGDLGLGTDNFQAGRRNLAYVSDPAEETEHGFQDQNRPAHYERFNGSLPFSSDHHEYDQLSREPYRNSAGHAYDVHIERHEPAQNGYVNYSDAGADRGRRDVPRSPHGSHPDDIEHDGGSPYVNIPPGYRPEPLHGQERDSRDADVGEYRDKPRHFSEGIHVDRRDDVNLTSDYRHQPRHFSEGGHDYRSDDAQLSSGYRQQPRHYSEGRHADRYDDVNLASGYGQHPRHNNDVDIRLHRERDSDVFVNTSNRNQPRHHDSTDYYDDSRQRDREIDRHDRMDDDRYPRHHNQSWDTRQYGHVTNSGRDLDSGTYDGGVGNRAFENDSDGDIEITRGMPPTLYTSTEV